MYQNSTIEKRLRLFRFGIITIVVTAFFGSLSILLVLTSKLPTEYQINLFEALLPATIIALLASLIGFMAYFAYSQTLQAIDD